MQLTINSQNSSKASNVLKAWGEIQEASLKPIIKPISTKVVWIPLLEHFWQSSREKRGLVQQQLGPGPILPKPFSQYVLPDSRDCKGGTMEYQRSDFCFWRFASVRFRLTVVSCVLPRQRRNAAKSLDFWSSCSWLWISVSSRHSYLSYGESYKFQATQEIKVNTWSIGNGSFDQYKIDYVLVTILDIYIGRSQVFPGK